MDAIIEDDTEFASYSLDSSLLQIIKCLAVNELDPEAAEMLTGLLVGDGLIFEGKNSRFRLERLK